jgi:HEAT repeat protein
MRLRLTTRGSSSTSVAAGAGSAGPRWDVAAVLVAFTLIGGTTCGARAASQTSATPSPKLATPSDPSVASFTRELETGDIYARESALIALGRLGPRAVVAIPHVLATVARENRESPPERERDIPYLAYAAVTALTGIGSPAVPQVIEALGHPDPLVQWVAATTLQYVEPPPVEAAPALGRAIPPAVFSEANFSLRAPMVGALGRLGPAAVPVAIELLKHDEASVRMAGLEVAAKVGPAAKSAVPPIIERLLKGNEYERESAIQALGGIGPDARAAIPLLQRTLNDDPHPQNHYLAKMALQRIQAPTP